MDTPLFSGSKSDLTSGWRWTFGDNFHSQYGKHCQKLNINFLAKKFGEKYSSMLAEIYVLIGEDVTSALREKESWFI